MKASLIILLILIEYISYGQELRMEEDFYESGKLYSKGYFKRIDKTSETSFGLWTYWYENGQKMLEEIQTDTKLTKYINFWTSDGAQTLINGNGKIIETLAFRIDDSTVFTVSDSLKNGHFISYSPVNGIYKKVSTGTFKNGLQQGVDTIFYSSGEIYLTRTYVDDEENGLSKRYYDNGNIKEQGLLSSYYKEGLWTYYDITGIMTKTITYIHNNMSGEYSEFYPNGQLKIKGNYIVVRVKNSETKAVVHKSKMKNYGGSGYGTSPYSDKSFKKGTWLFYSETGELKKSLNYSNGQVKQNGS